MIKAHFPTTLYSAHGLTPGAQYRLSYTYTKPDGSSESGYTSEAVAFPTGVFEVATALLLPVILGAVDTACVADHAAQNGGELRLVTVNATDLSEIAGTELTVPVA